MGQSCGEVALALAMGFAAAFELRRSPVTVTCAPCNPNHTDHDAATSEVRRGSGLQRKPLLSRGMCLSDTVSHRHAHTRWRTQALLLPYLARRVFYLATVPHKCNAAARAIPLRTAKCTMHIRARERAAHRRVWIGTREFACQMKTRWMMSLRTGALNTSGQRSTIPTWRRRRRPSLASSTIQTNYTTAKRLRSASTEQMSTNCI